MRRRVQKACRRCRDQKIKCTGSEPCDQCSKRLLACQFDSQSQRVLVTRRYINDLHERLAMFQNRPNGPPSPHSVPEQAMGLEPDSEHHARSLRRAMCDGLEAKAALTNPLAFHIKDWVPDPNGKPVFMGTSSSWAFGRRVLEMTNKGISGSSLSPDNLRFDGYVYDLNWDGNRVSSTQDVLDTTNLPSLDFARYLISSVQFHCNEIFYLFEESIFTKQMIAFKDDPLGKAHSSPLWFCHYLLLLAIGKSLVVQSAKLERPSGVEYFVQAMKCMPDLIFLDADPIEQTQVLCCAALYLQCLHHRTAAYRMIGLALRRALEHGMYTEMRSTYLDEAYVRRCNRMWWTVYVLERRMSSIIGVPPGISEESISAPFPSAQRHIQSPNALEMQIKLCQVLAKIDRTVYGVEGKLDSRYLGATQSVLRSIATVTEQLNNSFDLHENGTAGGISRVPSHLHLLEHQCIILTTQPLLYIFLQSKLGRSDPALMDWLQSETVKGLLHICVESAQQVVRILTNLLEQGLLDAFLPYNMDAAFTATISLLIAASIDSTILHDHSPYALTFSAHEPGLPSSADDMVSSLSAGEYSQTLENDFVESFGQH
ncbi:fungal-specific transcription factor domain-containing protein [Aspergillus avenaceus]|uniref:Fungal-specific transcription factor domain-containing protein n=1 Tax=Aspergillus avenaceus TaxID=36643 RepID=A0A5N6U9G4_ASPAV|nr:fungal-specific transcription factor domain-containing protein [Aspergillus avenaceus]